MQLTSTWEFEGWDIRYGIASSSKTAGEEEPLSVVFVHGTPWSSAVYCPLIDALLARGNYRILAYDLPGYGQSQKYVPSEGISKNGFEGDTSVKFQAHALAELIRHVGFDQLNRMRAPAVIAHDIAGTIVMRAHLLRHCNFSSMMLLDTNAVLPWGDGFYKLVRANPQSFVQLSPAIFEAVLRAVIKSASFDPKTRLAGWEDVLAQPWLDDSSSSTKRFSSQQSFIRQIAQANDLDVAEMLADNLYEQVRCDVKILWGKHDQWIPKEKMEALVDKLKGRAKEFIVIPDAGHLVMLDQPERVAIEIFEWLWRTASQEQRT